MERPQGGRALPDRVGARCDLNADADWGRGIASRPPPEGVDTPLCFESTASPLLAMSPAQRKQKLIHGSFQVRLVSRFVGLAALALLLQFLVLGFFLFRSVSGMEGDGGELYGELPGILLAVFGISIAIVLPILFGFGVALTFRIAGPLHRIELFLAEVAEGEADRPCQIRAEDELQELCRLANLATERARSAGELRKAG